jgi:hypothetical protein
MACEMRRSDGRRVEPWAMQPRGRRVARLADLTECRGRLFRRRREGTAEYSQRRLLGAAKGEGCDWLVACQR